MRSLLGIYGPGVWKACISGLEFSPPPSCGGSRSRGSFVFCVVCQLFPSISRMVCGAYGGVWLRVEGLLFAVLLVLLVRAGLQLVKER